MSRTYVARKEIRLREMLPGDGTRPARLGPERVIERGARVVLALERRAQRGITHVPAELLRHLVGAGALEPVAVEQALVLERRDSVGRFEVDILDTHGIANLDLVDAGRAA